MKRHKKKWSYSHPIRSLNTLRIFNLLRENWTLGLRQNEIVKKTELSKPTVSLSLKELLSDHKIFKLNNLYFPEFDDDFRFGYFLSDYVNFFLTKIMEKTETISNLMNSPNNPKLTVKDPLDTSIFEFSNAIGGLITYILIQSSSVYNNDREDAKIIELINNIFKGVIWENIYYQFGNLFRNTSSETQTTNNGKGFNKLYESIKRVYPRLYEALEINRIQFFKEWIKNDPRDVSVYENCDHEWIGRYMYKCGKYEECAHCHYQRLLK
jgi:hypothetical protein